jgi:hypothetical protein
MSDYLEQVRRSAIYAEMESGLHSSEGTTVNHRLHPPEVATVNHRLHPLEVATVNSQRHRPEDPMAL